MHCHFNRYLLNVNERYLLKTKEAPTLPIQQISVKPRRMARPKKYVEDMAARFLAGTFERIARVLREGEDRADFVREAVDKELRRRERLRRSDDRAGE